MIYRQEHPNPQWERENWRNLNGEWEFDFDFGKSAINRTLYAKGALPKKINVPFCPESELSGIGYKDFMDAVCYRKVITLSKEDLESNIFLHFGAVDYKCHIYINQELIKMHIGGYSSFKIDITKHVKEGENEIFLYVEDELRNGEQAAGKQSDDYNSWGCFYTRTTGIWQTVWLEFVPKSYIKSAKYYPDAENGTITVIGEVYGGGTVNISTSYEGKDTGNISVKTNGNNFCAQIKLEEIHLWEPGHGRLYDLELKFGDDKVKSYFGLRNVALKGRAFTINSKCVFQRFALDQGFYPDGIYTAKTEEDMIKDIEISMNAGFNGARLHQKIFEPRFLYHCDKAGYMVWEEHACWGMQYTNTIACENFMCEWLEVIERDFNHPSIIGWCPFNETWNYYELRVKDRLIDMVYRATKQADNTRPCIAVSGNYHIDDMEIHDVHDYCGNLDEFIDDYAHIDEGIVNDQVRKSEGDVQKYTGGPIFVSEYGGFRWAEDGADGWGYGEGPKTKEEFMEKYKTFTNSLLDNPDIMGYCYTQLYDVEQEINGLYTYGRKPKFDIDKIKAINSRIAKIEEVYNK